MSLASPLHGFHNHCSTPACSPVPCTFLLLPYQQWKQLLSDCKKNVSRRRTYPLFRLRCTVQPLQNVQNIRKVARGLEGTTTESNGVFGSNQWRALPDIWRTAAEKFGEKIALVDPHHQPVTQMSFTQLRRAILEFAEGLRVLGISANEKVALFADNSCRWLVADQGIMAAGAIDAVRGTRSSIDELLHIYMHSDSVALVVDNFDLYSKLERHLEASANVKFIVFLWGEKSQCAEVSEGSKLPVYTYEEILAKGQESRNFLATGEYSNLIECESIEAHDVATLVYTSGTTGNPKGVMLTHANLLHQVRYLGEVVDINPGDRFVSLLPPWHMYERSCEYFSLAQGIEQVYTNIKSLKVDLKNFAPDYLVSVPLVFDTLYRGIQKQILAGSKVRQMVAFTLIHISMMYMDLKRIYQGKALARAKMKKTAILSAGEWVFALIMAALLFPLHLLARKLVYNKIHAAIGIKKAGISGGGSLAPHVDRFFEAIEITLLNGYGLTESSPVISARIPQNNVLGTVGKPLHGTEIKVVNPESGESFPHGTRGLVKARGPQVMKGYYKNHAATVRSVDEDGWLDTGDLGWIVPYNKVGPARFCSGMLVLDGRAKDTIVLSTGENIDPTQIEESAMQSNFIHQIMVVGQDQRRLGALIVPNKEELQAKSLVLTESNGTLSDDKKVMGLIRDELNTYTSGCSIPIGPFVLIHEPFTIESGLLTPTMKIRRNIIAGKYRSQIEALFQ